MKFLDRKHFLIAIIFLAGLLVNKYLITLNRVEGESMLPTLKDGSFVVSLTGSFSGFSYERGRIYISKPGGFGGKIIKRLIALPGEQVWIDNGIIYVDGKNMTEQLQLTKPKNSDGLHCKYFSKYSVPANHYFFIGDNLCFASDSRNLGAIAEENIIAKVIFTLNLWDLFFI